MKWRLRLLVSALLFAAPAGAQYCPPMPIPGTCNPALQGNPLDTRNGASFDTTLDFSVRTSLWEFPFERRFISNAVAWQNWGSSFPDPLNGVPAPYGKGPAGTGLRMWHSLYSLAAVGTYVAVRDLSGYQTEFNYCNPASSLNSFCWATVASHAPSIRARLKVQTIQVSPSIVKAPSLVQPDGLVLNYRANRMVGGNPSPLFFLSSIGKMLDATTETPLLSVTYFGDTEAVSLPPAFSTMACSSSDTGVPFIKEVTFQPASNRKLYFRYELVAQQCVLKKVIHHAADGTDTDLVSYSYSVNSGGFPELASRSNISSATTVTEGYDYSYGFSRYAFGPGLGLITQKNFDQDYKIVYSTGGGLTRSSVVNGSSSTTCAVMGPDTCCASAMPLKTELYTTGSAGDGTISIAGIQHTYYSMPGAYDSTHEMVLYRKVDSYWHGSSLAMSLGSEDWVWRDTSGGPNCDSTKPGVLWAYKNKRGSFTVTPHTLASPGNPPQAIEQTARLVGATDREGAGALESETYAYSYGPNGEQRLASVTRPSAIQAGSNASTVTTYEGDRVVSEVRGGSTKSVDGTVQFKGIGTYYKTSRSCMSPASDSVGRTLRIEGPCEINLLAGGCNAGSYPVTEFEYEPGTSLGDTNGRLLKVWRFPNYSSITGCGNALLTQYTSYSPQGMPTSIIDESGVTTSFTYTGELVASKTVGASTTYFEYEGSRLTKTTYPLGNYERFCYRSGASTACTGGTLTEKLQWKAKYDSSGAWTERVEFQYGAHDGTLERSVFLRNDGSPAGEVRLETVQDRDAQMRLAFEQSGSGSVPSMQVKSAFDGADNRIATSVPFASSAGPVPNFCSSNSSLCRWMSYDRADRLAQMDAHPTNGVTAASQRTCIEYDKQGNIRRVVGGCSATGAACPIDLSNNTGTATCNQGYVDYEVDDFGNTTAITFPWTGNTGARGTTRFEYDARGNVVKKQTAEMAVAGATVVSSYDQLGRLVEVRQMPSNQVLYTLGYDADYTVEEAPEAGCVPMGSVVARGNGRLTLREDSFGRTWYFYDELGNVTDEVRRRSGMSAGCGGGAAQDKNPSSKYSYNANGAIAAITYPHGRIVRYVYPTSGAMDRPSSISYHIWDGSAWSVAATTLIDNINWEPYGELRAYRFASTGQWVEYLRQGTLETAPTSSTCTGLSASGWGSTDGSGRLRGVFVSDGAFQLGSPNGNILKQVYTWSSDQLVRQHTCHRNAGAPMVEEFAYDLLPRLTAKTDGAASVAFAYDRRNNRTSTDLGGPFSCSQAADWWSAAWQVDLPFSTKWGPAYGTSCNPTSPASGKYNYWYDRDGRRINTWDETTLWSVQTNYAQNTPFGPGVDSVFKTASISGSSGFRMGRRVEV